MIDMKNKQVQPAVVLSGYRIHPRVSLIMSILILICFTATIVNSFFINIHKGLLILLITPGLISASLSLCEIMAIFEKTDEN